MSWLLCCGPWCSNISFKMTVTSNMWYLASGCTTYILDFGTNAGAGRKGGSKRASV